MKVCFEGKKESLDVGESESCIWELGNGVGERSRKVWYVYKLWVKESWETDGSGRKIFNWN